MAHRKWSRDELIVAFNLYCKLPFGKIHIRNPLIIELAKAIGRTPSSVSWKLANFARLDPSLQQRNIVGATHGSQGEVDVWDEFNNNWEQLAFESERLLGQMTGHVLEEMPEFPVGREREALVRARVNQSFFRSAVLAAYSSCCCITGLSIPQLLNASHIVPWAVDASNRTNPRNGLCLNALHDRAFDCGMLTITLDLKVKLSNKIGRSADIASRDFLHRYEGAALKLPSRFMPHPKFLQYHNEKVFQS